MNGGLKRFISAVNNMFIINEFSPTIERWIRFLKNKKRFHGILRFNRNVDIDPRSTFEGGNSIGAHSYFKGSIGFGTYIAGSAFINAKIGRFTLIGVDVRTAVGTHPFTTPYATNSQVFFYTKKQAMRSFTSVQRFDEELPPVEIGNDCWIGDKVEIVGGKKIRDGAVVLSCAKVTKDVPPYAIVGGVPARIIKYRYDQETIDLLVNSHWWDKPLDWLEEQRGVERHRET